MAKKNGKGENPNTVYKLANALPSDYAKNDALSQGPRRILVSIPSYSGDISYATHAALARSSGLAHERGWVIDMSIRATDSILKRARDVMISEFIDRFTSCSDLVFVDHDIAWTAEGFIRLLSYPVDVVGAAYRSRGDPECYVLRSLDNELQRDPETGLMEVEALGTGFLRITRRAATMIANARGPDAWYHDPTAQGLRIRDIFDFKVIDHQLVSEDYLFCEQWRKLGGKVWLDPDQDMGHSGIKLFTGNLMRWLEAQGEQQKIPDHVPKGGVMDYLRQQHEQGETPSLLEQAKALVADVS